MPLVNTEAERAVALENASRMQAYAGERYAQARQEMEAGRPHCATLHQQSAAIKSRTARMWLFDAIGPLPEQIIIPQPVGDADYLVDAVVGLGDEIAARHPKVAA